MGLGDALKVFGALVDWLGISKALQLVGWGRFLLDQFRKLESALKAKVKP